MSDLDKSENPSMDGEGEARTSRSAVAYAELLSRLRHGKVTVDDRMVDLEIAAQLGMSRMPVREALLQLVGEGYLVSTARGYRIPKLSRQDMEEVFELRKMLEPRAAAHAARDFTKEGLARLKAALDRATKARGAGDNVALFQANLDFRATWIEAVRNSRLRETITKYGDQILEVRRSTMLDPEVQVVALRDMNEIYQAFAKRDAVRAYDATFRFVLDAEQHYALVTVLGIKK